MRITEAQIDQLRLKISSVIRNLDPELVQKHVESVKNRLYQLVRYNKMRNFFLNFKNRHHKLSRLLLSHFLFITR
jgi:hypothetical protein